MPDGATYWWRLWQASPSPEFKLMKPTVDVPNVGRIAILTEPNGAGVGWMTPVG